MGQVFRRPQLSAAQLLPVSLAKKPPPVTAHTEKKGSGHLNSSSSASKHIPTRPQTGTTLALPTQLGDPFSSHVEYTTAIWSGTERLLTAAPSIPILLRQRQPAWCTQWHL